MQVWRDAAFGVRVKGGSLLRKPQYCSESVLLRHRVSGQLLRLAYALGRVVFAQPKSYSPPKEAAKVSKHVVGLARARLDCWLHSCGLSPCCESLHQALHGRDIDTRYLHPPKLAAVFQHVGAGCLTTLPVVLLGARRESLELGGSVEALVQEGQSASLDLAPRAFHNRVEFRKARMSVCDRPFLRTASLRMCFDDVPAAILPIHALRQGGLIDMGRNSWVELPFLPRPIRSAPLHFLGWPQAR